MYSPFVAVPASGAGSAPGSGPWAGAPAAAAAAPAPVSLHVLSQTEMAALRAQFIEFDSDRNNRLTIDEVKRLLSRRNFFYDDSYVSHIIRTTFDMTGNLAGTIAHGLALSDFYLFMQVFLTMHDTVRQNLQSE